MLEHGNHAVKIAYIAYDEPFNVNKLIKELNGMEYGADDACIAALNETASFEDGNILGDVTHMIITVLPSTNEHRAVVNTTTK